MIKINFKTLLSNNLTAMVPTSTNKEIAANKEKEPMLNAALASNEEQPMPSKK